MHSTKSTPPVPSRKGMMQRISPGLLAFLATLLALPVNAGIQIPTDPLTTGTRVPPNILFVLDDSGSMGDTFMPDGLATGWPRQAYTRNTIYYNPATTYLPWLDAAGNPMTGGVSYNAAYSSVEFASGGTTDLLAATQTFYVPKNLADTSATYLNNEANYYRYQIIATTGRVVRSELLNNVTGSAGVTGVGCTNSNNGWQWKNCTYALPTTVRNTEALERANFATWYSYHRSRGKVAKAGAGRAFAQIGKDVRMGFRTIHKRYNASITGNPITQAKPIPVLSAQNIGLFIDDPAAAGGAIRNRTFWYDRLYSTTASDNTPLRDALNQAGVYFETDTTATGPWGPQTGVSQYACRQNFTILTTDGYRNDSFGNVVGEQDNVAGALITNDAGASYQYQPALPYSSAYSNNLADIAMRYWKTDMRTDLDNIVAPSTENPAFWQHMVTFAISIGAGGTLNPKTDLPSITAGTRSWPNPGTNLTPETIDDLWHAAVNGRGDFVVANNPDEFSAALNESLAAIVRRTGSFSNVAANSARLQAGTRLFQASYVSGVWTGELVGFDRLNPPERGFSATPAWRASTAMPAAADRNIFTSNGTAGLEFPASATAAQIAALTRTGVLNYPVTGAQNAAYLAGDQSLEKARGIGVLRDRTQLLGDIVSSSPAYVDDTGTIYVGANDGMLHAFSAANGQELFGYIPNLVNWSSLGNLSRPDYAHQYSVDGAVVVSSRKQTPGQNILVGALGRGGKGIYALDVTNPASFGIGNFKWERAETTNNLMGQVLSRPIIAKLNNNVTAVIVANGPNSTAERAALLIYNLDTGALIGEIDTGAGSAAAPNGLFAPVGIDQDSSGTLDYVYAGDMLGNVWKFDLSAATRATWENAASRTRLFTATSPTGTVQPITGGLTLGMNPSTYKTWVFFGTGRFITTGDVADRSVQSLYGIEDSSTTLTRAVLTSRKTVVATTKDGQRVRGFEATQALPVTSKGWYIDLVPPSPPGATEGERVVTPPQMDGSVLEVSSIIPTSTNACQADGRGYLNALDAFTGTSAKKPYFDVDGDGDFSDETVSYTDSSGRTVVVPIGSVDLGVGMVTQGSLFSGNPDALGLICAGGSAGGVGCRGKNDPRNVGRVSWREIRQE
ncbi:PilC/PilY family type IV pilus protein [Pseudoxanthomonas sp. SL93]|uniref:pilus assembly protein n=1 Tax=Pseudoxanthomonas sp. SL93 TaxID=2995142 RepID=UPI00226F9D9C|nr:PilC/PilY family type IV pilus protein [Pseudoxanthomonas sp. SL93]WAC63305.1 PilC/PilY family type IV pilus protein [Pseudoxanthomonas sp. SL93]